MLAADLVPHPIILDTIFAYDFALQGSEDNPSPELCRLQMAASRTSPSAPEALQDNSLTRPSSGKFGLIRGLAKF